MPAQAERFNRTRRWWLSGLLLVLTSTLGCNPGAITMLLLPFMDDKVPARCKLSKKKEETTVVIYASCSKADVPLDLDSAGRELTEAVSIHLRKRLTANKEKVVIVTPAKVRSYTNSRLGERIDDQDIGEHFKADFVINLDIQALALYEPKSRMLFRGRPEIEVTVTDMKEVDGENRIFSEFYRTPYPTSGPIDAGGSSPTQFRAMFVNHMARDISRWFAAYPKDERIDRE